MANTIKIRKSQTGNIVFLGFKEDEFISQQVIAWAKPKDGDADKTIEAILKSKKKGTFQQVGNSYEIRIGDNGMEFEKA